MTPSTHAGGAAGTVDGVLGDPHAASSTPTTPCPTAKRFTWPPA
jgi:hypothetical protein